MMIQGCDLHTRYQQIAMLDRDRGNWWSGGWNTRTEKRGLFMRRFRGARGPLVWPNPSQAQFKATFRK